MRKALFIILPVVVLALGVSGGWYWWSVLRFQQSTDDAYVQSDITLISPKVEGYIKEVRVGDNQEVQDKPRQRRDQRDDDRENRNRDAQFSERR